MTKKIFRSILAVAGTVLLASLLVIMAACTNISAASKKSSCMMNWRLLLPLWRKTGRTISKSSPPDTIA